MKAQRSKRGRDLVRRTPLRPGKPLVRKRIERVTPARSKRIGDRRLRAAREEVAARAKGWCEIRVSGVCEGRGWQAHHRLRRSAGGPDIPENLLWTCRACHAYVHDHPAESYERGWLLRRVA